MAASVIGALRVNLGLDSAQFEKGARRVQTPVASLRSQFKLLAGVATAAGAAISAAALAGAADIDKAAKSARRLGSSIGGFRALELAADEAGVSLSSLTSDLQTMDREIASIGTSGNGQRALDKLGLTISDLSGLDADEKLAVIADQVSELGLTTGETTAVLRDLGVRNREMVLLVGQGGDTIRSARKDIEDYGLAVSQVDSDRIETANDAIGRLGLIGQYVGQQLAVSIVPAMGQLAENITDSLREGGLLRTLIDGLVASIGVASRAVASLAVAVGVRYVAAMVLATAKTITFAGALTALRGALIRTGVGALIIGAGELVYQFTRLTSGAGSFGAALGLLADVAKEVWGRIGDGASYVSESIKAMAYKMEQYFLLGLNKMAGKFIEFTWVIADGINSLFDTNLSGASAEITQEIGRSILSAKSAADAAAASARASAESFKAPLESLGALSDAVRKTKDEFESGEKAADDFGDSLDDESGGGVSGKAKKTKEDVEALTSAQDQLKDSARSAFTGIISGAKSAKDAIGELLKSFLDILANRAFESLWGIVGGDAIASLILPDVGGNKFANGTMSAPGGMALVGERGPELVNLPRGSRVNTAQQTQKMLDQGGGAVEVRVIGGDLVLSDSGQIMTTVQVVAGQARAGAVQDVQKRMSKSKSFGAPA